MIRECCISVLILFLLILAVSANSQAQTATPSAVISGTTEFVMQSLYPTPNPTDDIDEVGKDESIYLMWPWLDDDPYRQTPTPVEDHQCFDHPDQCMYNVGEFSASPSIIHYNSAPYWVVELDYQDYANGPEPVKTAIAEGKAIVHSVVNIISVTGEEEELGYNDCNDGGLKWVEP